MRVAGGGRGWGSLRKAMATWALLWQGLLERVVNYSNKLQQLSFVVKRKFQNPCCCF